MNVVSRKYQPPGSTFRAATKTWQGNLAFFPNAYYIGLLWVLGGCRLYRKTKTMRDPFVVSSVTWHEVPDEVAIDNINLIEAALKDHLKLSDYGEIVGIAFIYIIEQDDEHTHVDSFSYRPKRKEIYTQMSLPYAVVQQSSPEEVLHMMATKYVDTMQEYLSKKKIRNFDAQRFVKDVQELFERQNWLHSVAA